MLKLISKSAFAQDVVSMMSRETEIYLTQAPTQFFFKSCLRFAFLAPYNNSVVNVADCDK